MAAQGAPAQASSSVQGRGDPVFAKLLDGDGYSTLIVDRLGRICGCGVAAEDVFGASRSRLVGRQVAEFIAGIFQNDGSSSGNAPDLAGPCNGGTWRTLEATDARGAVFAVDIRVSRRLTGGQEVFVLSLRQPGNAPCS